MTVVDLPIAHPRLYAGIGCCKSAGHLYLGVVRQCAEVGISRVWLHRSFGQGSVSDAAVEAGREYGIEVIAGGCPMMYCQPVDVAHKCMRWLLGVTGKLP